MARLNILIALAALVVVFTSTNAQSATAPTTADGPDSYFVEEEALSPEELPPEPYPGFFALADRCTRKMSDLCEYEILSRIAFNATVSDQCCGELVAVGQRCHQIMRQAEMLGKSTQEQSQISKNDGQVWSDCVLVTNDLKKTNNVTPSS